MIRVNPEPTPTAFPLTWADIKDKPGLYEDMNGDFLYLDGHRKTPTFIDVNGNIVEPHHTQDTRRFRPSTLTITLSHT